MARIFIDRPVFAMVISIVIVLGGLVSMKSYTDRPVPRHRSANRAGYGSVSGSDSQRLSPTRWQPPLRRRSSGVEKMANVSTSSSTGDMTLTVTFEPGTDPNQAQVNVQIGSARPAPKLPEVVISRE